MREDVIKGTYINLYLLALADGTIDSTEEAYLNRFAKLAGISKAQQDAWGQEVQAGNLGFQSVDSGEDQSELLGLMAGMVRADGDFAEAEQSAYIAVGKALGVDHEELGTTLRQYWETNPLDSFSPQNSQSSSLKNINMLVLLDHMGDMSRIEALDGLISLEYIKTEALSERSRRADIVLFHLEDEREKSKLLLAKCKDMVSEGVVAFIARRDQAPQIGLLLEAGADKCFVEPLYPKELDKYLSATFL